MKSLGVPLMMAFVWVDCVPNMYIGVIVKLKSVHISLNLEFFAISPTWSVVMEARLNLLDKDGPDST